METLTLIAFSLSQSRPLQETEKISSIAIHLENVPCVNPTTVNFCSVFDSKGSFGFSLEGDGFKCIATSGIGAFLLPLAGATFLQFGYSPVRKWNKEIKIPFPNQNAPEIKTVTAKSHLYLGGKLTLPSFSVKYSGKTIDNVISGDLMGTLFMDFGDANPYSVEKVKTKVSGTKPTEAHDNLADYLSAARETTFTIVANLTIKLKEFSDGFFQDLKFEKTEVEMIISKPGPNGEKGSLGLEKGIYLRFTPRSNFLQAVAQPIIKRITDLFGFANYTPNFPALSNMTIALFIGDNFTDLHLIFGSSLSLICRIKYSTNTQHKTSINCGFDGNFLNILENGKDWVLKKASSLYDNSGAIIEGAASYLANIDYGAVYDYATYGIGVGASYLGSGAYTVGSTALSYIWKKKLLRRKLLKKMKKRRI